MEKKNKNCCVQRKVSGSFGVVLFFSFYFFFVKYFIQLNLKQMMEARFQCQCK